MVYGCSIQYLRQEIGFEYIDKVAEMCSLTRAEYMDTLNKNPNEISELLEKGLLCEDG